MVTFDFISREKYAGKKRGLWCLDSTGGLNEQMPFACKLQRRPWNHEASSASAVWDVHSPKMISTDCKFIL